MGTIPNSSLPFNDNAVNGDNVDYNAWNQLAQVVQLAVNDNQTQINAIKNAQTTILVAHGVAYPTNPAPSSGQLFYRDDLSQLKMFNGTLWEDVESVVATANGLSINGVSYEISASAIANTIALRDATGSLTAQTFNGNLNGNVSGLNIGCEFTIAELFSGMGEIPPSISSYTDWMCYFQSGLQSASVPSLNGNFRLTVSDGTASAPSYNYAPRKVLVNSINFKNVYLEATLCTDNGAVTAYAGLWDITANALVSGSTISSTSLLTAPQTVRSSPVTLISGHQYAVTVWSSTNTANNYLSSARIIGQI